MSVKNDACKRLPTNPNADCLLADNAARDEGENMKAGIIGLGKMGYNMALRLLGHGHDIVAYNRSYHKTQGLVENGATAAETLQVLVDQLEKPRIILLMLPAGNVVDEHIELLMQLLDQGDILIDGGNTHYPDDIRRAEILENRGINYLDAGVSGGIWGLQNGYCMMLGGKKEIFEHVRPLFADLAPPEGLIYCGDNGAGHFAKMVHNGIEYAIMQAYAEGFELMKESAYGGQLDLAALAHTWNHGSVIKSWLLELCASALYKNPELESIRPVVSDSGEGRWTVREGVDSGVPLPVIAASVFERFRSRQDNSFALRLLSALRGEFGGHAVEKE